MTANNRGFTVEDTGLGFVINLRNLCLWQPALKVLKTGSHDLT